MVQNSKQNAKKATQANAATRSKEQKRNPATHHARFPEYGMAIVM
jgi:hypothetical protein